ncbi:MAG: hypothetical protein KUG80_02185 [Gammaproteobacteria bacterium]|nr:hypothetical protein [Gammaproteobacteria bacterium]
MKSALLPLVIAVAASVSLNSGCSSKSNNSTPPAEITKSTLSGTAAKGIIQNGLIKAIELKSDGSDLAEVGSTTTDNKGHYELKLDDNYQGGVVRMLVSAGPTTKMKCDAFAGCGDGIDFGDSLDLEEGFELSSIVAPTKETVNVQITPLTHMAAARALSTATVDASPVANAISEVNQIVGADIMANEAPDITDAASIAAATSEAKQLALFNAGLAQLLIVGDGDIQTNMETNLEDLASAFEDGQFDATDDVTITAITTAVSTASTAVATADAAIASELSQTVENIDLAVASINGQITDGTYNPEPSESTVLSEIAQAKAMLTDTRTFVEQIATNFDDPLTALDIESKLAEDVLSEDTAAMSQLLTNVISQVFTHLDDPLTEFVLKSVLASESTTEFTVPIFNDDEVPQKLGDIITTFVPGDSGISIILNGTLTGSGSEGRSVELKDLSINTNLTADQLQFDESTGILATISDVAGVNLSITGLASAAGLDELPDTSITFNSVAFSVVFSETLTSIIAASITNEAVGEEAMLAAQAIEDAQNEALEAALSTASFIGDMTIQANGTTFNGDVELSLTALDSTSSLNPMSLKKIAVNGDFTGTLSSFSAGVSLSIDNATSFDTFAFMDHEEKMDAFVAFAQTLSDADKAILTSARNSQTAGGQTVTFMQLEYAEQAGTFSEHETPAGYSLYMLLNDGSSSSTPLNGISTDISTTIGSAVEEELDTTPESVLINYASLILDPSTLVTTSTPYALTTASFPELESANNYVKGTLMFSAGAKVPAMPNATVVVSLSRTELSGGDIDINVSQDGKSFKLNVDSTDIDIDRVKSVLTVTTPDNAALVMNLKETLEEEVEVQSGSVLIDGIEVGEIAETAKGAILVRYNDGTFESLF